VGDMVCQKHKLQPARCGFLLSHRIKAARSEGMIDEAVEKAAWRVNEPAKEAVHKDPHVGSDSLCRIEDTLGVIRCLAPLKAK
jgi:hypothetical protein